MNAAILLLVGSAIGSVVVFEARRKWRKWQRSRQPFRGTPLRDDVPLFDPKDRPIILTTPTAVDDSWVDAAMRRLAERPLAIPDNAAVWIGADLAYGGDLSIEHRSASYAADDQSSFGTIGGVSE